LLAAFEAIASDCDMNGSPRAEIEFWFEFGSNYSYLSVMRIEHEARLHRVAVAWKPFLLGPILRELGLDPSPFLLQKEKGAYVWQDMARQCRKYGLRWTQPSTFPRPSLLAARIALVGAQHGWIGEFCRHVMERNFVEDEDIKEARSLLPILSDLGLPADEIIARAQSEPIKALLRAQTDDARKRGIFGAPTFFVGQEMFWGNDRLDDALICAAERRRA
jgi:2-hydroxychromene-2-carboxylate isomerase